MAAKKKTQASKKKRLKFEPGEEAWKKTGQGPLKVSKVISDAGRGKYLLEDGSVWSGDNLRKQAPKRTDHPGDESTEVENDNFDDPPVDSSEEEPQPPVEPAPEAIDYDKQCQDIYDQLHRDAFTQEVIEAGLQIQSLRSESGAEMDKKRDNRKRLYPNKRNLKKWMKNPGRYDLIGVDNNQASDPTVFEKQLKKAKILNLFNQ